MFASLIRPASIDDLDVIAELNLRLADESEGMQLDKETVRRGVRAVLTDEAKGQYFVACIDGHVVGQTMITTEWSDWRCGHFWWIQSVYVRAEARRRGVFRALHAHVISEAEKRRDVVGVRLYVEEHNAIAQATYARLGMQGGVYKVMEQKVGR